MTDLTAAAARPDRTWSPRPRAVLLCAVFALLFLATLIIDLHTAAVVARSKTNVLWRDQWYFLGEWKSVTEGRSWAAVLWFDFWGHRSVVSRLLFWLFSFRNTPLLCIAWACLLGQMALIAAVYRNLFGSLFSPRFGTACLVAANLYFSSLQMENFIWAFQFQYPLTFFCATLSFFLFALNSRGHGKRFAVASAISALIGSLTMAQGLMIWPVLAVQALLSKRRPRVWLSLFATFVVLAGIYAVGYHMPQTGMGFRGQFHRPMRALQIALMVLGGPISNQSLAWGVAVGAAGAIALVTLMFVVYRDRNPVWPSVPVALALFIAATAWLTVGGRMTPELLKQLIAIHNEIVPSRYETFAFIFWSSLFALSLWLLQTTGSGVTKAIALVAAFVPAYMVVRYAPIQQIVADAWGDSMRSIDATGLSLLVGAPDWERQALLWSYRTEFEDWVAFARQRRLTNFSEQRYAWLNEKLADRFPTGGAAKCEGKVESVDRLSPTAWRFTGWAWDREAGKPPADLLLVDEAGTIRGLAGSGIRHHDTGGHSAAVVMWRAGWLGYAASEKVRAYAVLPRCGAGVSACACALQ